MFYVPRFAIFGSGHDFIIETLIYALETRYLIGWWGELNQNKL